MDEYAKNEGMQWGKAIGVGIIIVVFLRIFLISNYVVKGESMEPTLYGGNKLVINKINYQISDFNRFDVIVFHANEKEDHVKRIIGLPGDNIEYKEDVLYINGHAIDEPYLDKQLDDTKTRKFTEDFTLLETTGVEVIPEGKLFVMGDNRLKSGDSRIYGLVSVDSVVGKVDLRYWPLQQFNISF